MSRFDDDFNMVFREENRFRATEDGIIAQQEAEQIRDMEMARAVIYDFFEKAIRHMHSADDTYAAVEAMRLFGLEIDLDEPKTKSPEWDGEKW
jgi:hypothetical protein